MNNELKKIIIFIGVILAVLSIYFGSLLPFAKSKTYINALNKMPSVKSLEDFKNNFDVVFDFYSPVGDEETEKFLSSSILGIVSQKEQPENVSRYLVEYIEPKLQKNNVRHLIMIGQMYMVLWQKSGKEEDFVKAEEYYYQALSIGPKLPPVLYGLFDLYQAKGDTAKIREISERILQLWPEDEKIKSLITNY
ncbi:tetratricopeptide repeat protein [Candidatus Wolfebacteria bacterium]|nr:tetratricopeptide repeat protein [Candidatus Wolfebacteria bacterium]